MQFGFQPQYSTTNVVINLPESIRQSLDEGSFSCGIFVDLQKPFDTVDYKILLHKSNQTLMESEAYVMTGSSLTSQILKNLSLSIVLILI